jgi:hypothetical protein
MPLRCARGWGDSTLSERRATITLGWRPPGAPARRIDDFCEAAPTPAVSKPAPARVIERRSIGRRLENWGMWANNAPSSVGGRGNNMTAVICENMRRLAGGELGPAASVDDRIDVVDAERIQAALIKIDEMHRWVLNWTYVMCAKPWAVAGACGFPSKEYGVRLGDAQAAIESVAGALGAYRS